MLDRDALIGNIETVRARLAAAAAKAGRRADAVALMAVSKTQPADAIAALIAAGQRLFGENRVQEAAQKWPPLRARHSDLKLHLIGPLQSNKARQAVQLFDCIESVDRPKLVTALARIAEEEDRQIDLFIQVNTGEEPQKAGVAAPALASLIEMARAQPRLHLRGLMCIPPADDHPGPHFALLAKLAARHGLAELSMGMSQDYERAAMLGATHVRVGSQLFGPRPA
ncbi:MAG: YggS family pyridoxal phosphate-dependent enzyme [Sphingomonadales bacterium]